MIMNIMSIPGFSMNGEAVATLQSDIKCGRFALGDSACDLWPQLLAPIQRFWVGVMAKAQPLTP